MRVCVRFAAPVLSVGLLLPGCQTPARPSGPDLLAADGRLCPGWEEFDGAAIIALSNEQAAERAAWIQEYTAVTPLPPGAEEAETRIRVRVPPTSMWPRDTRVTLWRDMNGAWQIATDNKNYSLQPPPPPPPPPVDEHGNLLPGYEDWGPALPPPPPPYSTSALDDGSVAQLESILADPCFVHGPDSLPYQVPLKHPEPDLNMWICPPDSAYYMAEVKQAGRPNRYISHSCYMDFAVSKLLTLTAYLQTSPQMQ